MKADIVERLRRRLSEKGDCPEPENATNEDKMLTAAEREAIEVAAEAYADDHGERFAATLRKLLERLG